MSQIRNTPKNVVASPEEALDRTDESHWAGHELGGLGKAFGISNKHKLVAKGKATKDAEGNKVPAPKVKAVRYTNAKFSNRFQGHVVRDMQSLPGRVRRDLYKNRVIAQIEKVTRPKGSPALTPDDFPTDTFVLGQKTAPRQTKVAAPKPDAKGKKGKKGKAPKAAPKPKKPSMDLRLKSQWKVLVPENSKKPGDLSDMMKPALLAEDLRKAFVPVITDFSSGSDTYKGFRAAFTKQRYAMYGLQLAVDAEEQKLIAALGKDGQELITKPVDGTLTEAQKESNAAFRQALRDAKAESAAYKKAVAAQTAGETKVKNTLTKMLDKVLKAFNKDHGLAEDFAWKEVRKSVLKLAKCKMPTAGRRNLGEKSGASGASSSGKRSKKE